MDFDVHRKSRHSTYIYQKLYDIKKYVPKTVRDSLKPFMLGHNELRIIKSMFENEITKGLQKKDHRQAKVKCFITYVQDLPNGYERGRFLSLDFSSATIRILMVEFSGREEENIVQKTYEIPRPKQIGTGKELFDFVAKCLADFCKEYKLSKVRLPLGFTFGFPLKQEDLQKGILENWAKEFNASGVVGQNVVEVLAKSLKERMDISIDVVAVINDTTGTLMSGSFHDPETYIGCIVCDGSNACYVEKVKRCENFNVETEKPFVIINTEWGAYGDDGILDYFRTKQDFIVDETSINPRIHVFEKMISGLYMGEIIRLILVDLAAQGLFMALAKGNLGGLREKNSFQFRHVKKAKTDDLGGDYGSLKELLEEFGIDESRATISDLLTLRFVCEVISNRGADLVAATICSLLEKMGRKKVSVAVDGSLFKANFFAKRMQESVNKLAPRYCKATLKMTGDGAGLGAALVAAVAGRESRASRDKLIGTSTISGLTISPDKLL